MCPIRSFFWSVFSCIRIEYADLRSLTEIYGFTRKNSVFGHFLCSVVTWKKMSIIIIGIQPRMYNYFIQIPSFLEQLFRFLARRLLYVVLDSTLGFHFIFCCFEANYSVIFLLTCFKKLGKFKICWLFSTKVIVKLIYT